MESNLLSDKEGILKLPVETMVKIFQQVVDDEGAVPFLCRAAQVCSAWNRAAACPSLWRSVSIDQGGSEPGTIQLHGIEQKETVDWLARERFSQLMEFSLFHCNNNVDYVVQKVVESSTRLQSLKLSHCMTVTMMAFESLLRCCSLEHLNLQHSEFNVLDLVSFLQDGGTQMKGLCFTHSCKSEQILYALYRGCCPELRLLEFNEETDAEVRVGEILICIRTLQSKCPKLQTFRLINVTLICKELRNAPSETPGFPLLEELSIPTDSDSMLSSTNLIILLHGSPCLRVLNLRGAVFITCAALCRLPCEELERLFWGKNSATQTFSTGALHLVTNKWRNTLRQLDLTNHSFSKEEMSFALQEMPFCSLNLSGTQVDSSTLRELISKAPGLTCLNVSSCQNLPTEHQRLFQGREEIQQLFEKLECQE